MKKCNKQSSALYKQTPAFPSNQEQRPLLGLPGPAPAAGPERPAVLGGAAPRPRSPRAAPAQPARRRRTPAGIEIFIRAIPRNCQTE